MKTTMNPGGRLEAELRGLLRRAAAARASDVDNGNPEFRELTRAWFRDEVLPRLRALQRTFGTGDAIRFHDTLPHAALTLPAGSDQPVDATLEVRAAPHRGRARFSVDAFIMPVLVDYERTASFEVDLGEPDLEGLGRFLDERFLRFALDARRTGEPRSPYREETTVTDPVCWARIPRHEAAGFMKRNGKTRYFCSLPCWEAYARRPGRYTG